MSVRRAQISITGAGVACAVGTGCGALWEALASGRDGLRPIERFSIAEFAPHFAGLWLGFDGKTREQATSLELALTAAREAWANARAGDAGVSSKRVALVLGTCFGEGMVGFSELGEALAKALGVEGPCLTVSTACASSTTAIGIGRELIDEGAADLVIAGGVDVLTREVFAGFHAIGALHAAKCAPFGEPPGMTLGEGAGFLILERAEARPIPILGHVLGYGLSADAHHETSPDPSGSGVTRAIAAALDDAGVAASEVDFVSAHGTGTDSNDTAEWLGVRTALGNDHVAISSSKSFLGHAQGAAGVLELACLLLAMQRGQVPQTLRALPARPGAPADPVATEKPREHAVRNALKLSAAFGGANAALVIGKRPVVRERAARRAVRIAGLSAIGPHGLDLDALEAAFAAGNALAGAVAPFEAEQLIRSAPPRDLDPSGKYATAAAALALADARIAIKGAARARSGIFTGNVRMPARSVHDCQASIERRGINAIAVTHFTHMVLNAPAGMAAKLLALKGPLVVLSAGRASGLLAIIRAAEHLAARGTADLIVAGGLDELPCVDPDQDPRGPAAKLKGTAEGAAFAVLRAGAEPSPGSLTLEGWGLAGPGETRLAVERAGGGAFDAIYSAGADGFEGPVFDVQAFAGGAEAASSSFAFVLGAARVRSGKAKRVLVVSGSESLSCAAILSGGADGQ